jgi:prevent-host-death family protein
MVMKTMAAGEFKARCLRVMDGVRVTREPVVITKKGKPVAKLVPVDAPAQDIFGCMKDEIEILGDIESPILPAEDWEMLR